MARRPRHAWGSALAGVVTILALIAAACGPRGPGRSAGARAAKAGPPRRIVSLVPAGTEMLFAIGAGPRVAAVSSFDHDPPEVARLPRVGALLDPNLEAIVRLEPDLVIADASQPDTLARLRSMQIRTFVYSHPGLADITRAMRELGGVLGLDHEAGRAAASLQARLDAVRARAARESRPRTLLVFGREPSSLRSIYASGGVGFLADLLDVAGGENVFAGVHREGLQVSTEAVLAAAPDVILELQPGDGRSAARRADQAWQALPGVPAVARGRVYVLVGDEFVVPGPRVGEAAERMARALHQAPGTRQ